MNASPGVQAELILRKYLAWLSSTAVLVVMGSLVLPKGFVEIADWFGPLFGPTFRPELSLVFLTLGPSLEYTPLLMTWVVAGVVGGFFARGVLRSMAAGTLSTITIVLLIIANGFIIFAGIGGFTGGLSGFTIPPPPPGANIADIANAPLVGQGMSAIAGGGLNPISILRSLATNILVNHVIFAVSFLFSGFVFSKLFPARRSNPGKFQNSTQRLPSTEPTVRSMIIVSAIMTLVLMGLFLPAGFAAGSQSAGGVSGEQLTLNLQQDGTLNMAYSTNISALPGVPSDYQRTEFQGLMGGFIFSFNGSVDLGQNGAPGGSLSFLTALLPPNGFVAAYAVPDSSTARARADILASEFAQGFGENLKFSASMALPSFGGQQVPGGEVFFVVYTGDGQAGVIGARVLSLVQGTGVGSILSPQQVFVSQFGVQAGFINLGLQNPSKPPMFVPAVQVTADLTPLGNFYGRGNFTLGLRQTFGGQGTIGPSIVARSTSIQLVFPTNSTVTGYRPTNATLNLAQGQLTYSMNVTSTSIPNMYVNFTGTFPERVRVSRQFAPQSPIASGNVVTESITVANLGNQTIRGVMVSEKRLFQTYPTLQLLSSSQNVSLGDIAPQTSAGTAIQFKVGSDGFYTLPPVDTTFVDQGQTVRKASDSAYLQSSFSYVFYLKQLVRGTAPYSYLFLLILALPPILQVPKLRRRSGEGKRYAPVPVSVGYSPNTAAAK